MNANSVYCTCFLPWGAQIASENDINDIVIFDPHLFIISGRTENIFFKSDHIG